ncbi:1-acyl-sn-glycerol-3-phosphate acyltransferase [Allokutzneria sp. A3M-2-11 16]|uniref:lysophospholipid acyltransferase family protein n=1 Tax=Allokutzneria sp. A3M-2-11 16 TaxID=2962043 RepID=UPI0020B6A2B2|nr:lysophospholipid acyltransferase family protein [Allokutzneria sp. A3M-2-11 16]MCP3799777.1 1-acyl-sn-glycerol-3-phosphate acyltransferase [Allokutzneria sp. A3M-2-11 16]
MTAHAWMPQSPCGLGCLQGEDTVSPPRRALRMLALIAVMLTAPLCGGRKWWFRAVLRALGAKLKVFGEPERQSGVLVVGNHTSWLDIVAVNAVLPARALAKREVGEWPVIGALAARAGTVFVDRAKLSTLPATVAELAEVMRGGAAVSVFPEGTTWCGRESGRYKPAAFQAAIDAGVPVRPVALRFVVAGKPTTAASFLGEETFLTALHRTVALRGLEIEVHVLPLINSVGRDRRSLAAAAETAVRTVAEDRDRAVSGCRPHWS